MTKIPNDDDPFLEQQIHLHNSKRGRDDKSKRRRTFLVRVGSGITMMRQTSLLKWTHSSKSSNNNSNKSKTWIHPPDALQRGHVVYLVKFFGNTEVDQPKGIEIVKEGIRKLKFSEHLKRAEGGKTPKVELTISVDGVAIQEPKTKKILYQYPLHRISYCADDKSDKKFFSFIAKESDDDGHNCFVFVSDKLSEEITLTIGQAFDLAYRRFLETSGRDLEMRRQIMILQKRVNDLEKENTALKFRITDYEKQENVTRKASLDVNYDHGTTMLNGSINGTNSTKLPPLQPPPQTQPRMLNKCFSNNQGVSLLDIDMSEARPTVGRKLENLSLDDIEDDFNPRETETNKSLSNNDRGNITVNGNGHIRRGTDAFGSKPFNAVMAKTENDPFGMGSFGTKDLEKAIGAIDKKLAEMRDGFSRGLSFGNDDFSLDNLDPLKSSKT